MSVRRWWTRRGGRLEAVAGELTSTDPWAVARARRTCGALLLAHDWVWPLWLERQGDPASPAFVPRGDLPAVANVCHRNWTVVGNLDSPRLALVDPRGLVTPAADGWSLDWWIGADDRWHVPAREVGVRQHLIDASPVVETAARIPGGDAVQRVYAIRRSSQDGGGELVVVEVENRSKLPVALALAIRPVNPHGIAPVERIDLDGTTVAVDGRPALLLPKPPARVAASTLARGDSAQTVLSGAAPAAWPGPVRCPAGLAQAAFVYPLAHGATLRVALPLLEPRGSAGRRPGGVLGALPRGGDRPTTFPTAVPPAAHVAKGWEAQTRRGLRLDLPDARLAEAMAANRRFLLLLHHRAGATADPVAGRPELGDVAAVVSALDHYGLHDEATDLIVPYAEHQRGDGRFIRAPATGANVSGDASLGGPGTAAVLRALATHWQLTGDRALVEALASPIARAAQWIERTHRHRPGAAATGGTREAPDQGSAGHAVGDELWSVAGLRAAAELLRAAHQPRAAADADRAADGLWSGVEPALTGPLTPSRGGDIVDAVAEGAPLAALLAGDERVAALADVLRQRIVLGDDGQALASRHDPASLGPAATLHLASIELLAGDRRCLERLAWLLDVATPTWTWPSALHPRLLGGTAGDGHDVAVAAALLSLVRDLVVREDGAGLVLASVVPDAWVGQGWEVHDAPTGHGRLSYAVRWHGSRPALLWELEPHPAEAGESPAAEVRLSAPGLDRAWSSTERQGEALLAPVEHPGVAAQAPQSSLS